MEEKPRISGGIRLFEITGITVFLHWSWFLIAVYDLRTNFSNHGSDAYSFKGWYLAEYLSLFAIILLHEFGHALACRSVGGTADRIMLWPLGGVAFVSPPPRPGAVLWSIAAGPLVNIALVPITFGVVWGLHNIPTVPYDAAHFAENLSIVNLALLAFNLLPIYPLDGGQILQSLLWFIIGRAWSLRVAAVFGIIGAAAVALLGLHRGNTLLIVMAGFGVFQCINGLRGASALIKRAKMPRHEGFSCPQCGNAPIKGDFWRCQCGAAFDTFETNFACPQCGQSFPSTMCGECRKSSATEGWRVPAPDVSGTVEV